MKGIITEGIRGAFIRIIRLIVYIILTIAIVYIIGLFTSKKAYALVYKDSFYSTQTVNGQTNGTIAGAQTITWNFNNYDFSNDYDYLGLKFGTFNISHEFSSGDYCTRWIPVGTAPNLSYQCGANTGTTGQSYTYISNIYINPTLHYYYNNADYYVPCTFDSSQEYMFYCPLRKDYDPVDFVLEIKSRDNANFQLTLNGFKYYYNNDSTEIVNGLTGISIQQQQTTTIIQQQTQTITDTNVSSSTSNFQSGISDLTTSINAEISGVNDLTQIVLLPVTLFMNLATGTCSPLQLTVPFTNNQIELPCMMPIYNQHFGALLTIFQTIVSAVTTYWVSVNTAKLFKEILDCDNDRIEVIDL